MFNICSVSINKISPADRGNILDRNGCLLVTNAGTSRFYPEGGEFLCHILGFTGSGGGLEGLEYFYDKELKKRPGFSPYD
jgi:cell division protein FtsI/penicillin-binding protein 2